MPHTLRVQTHDTYLEDGKYLICAQAGQILGPYTVMGYDTDRDKKSLCFCREERYINLREISEEKL